MDDGSNKPRAITVGDDFKVENADGDDFYVQGTWKRDNDYEVDLCCRFNSSLSHIPLKFRESEGPEKDQMPPEHSFVNSLQVFFGATFTKDHAIGFKGIAAAGGWNADTNQYVRNIWEGFTEQTGSFGNALFAVINTDGQLVPATQEYRDNPDSIGRLIPAFPAPEAKAIGKAMKSKNSTANQARAETLKKVMGARRGSTGRFTKTKS
ncbi:MAG: hypothetical protein OEQ39_25835 [Gammaproteobacteria bacterium]|nr:hypothetical protein [Gammaproteobacteria bacterium]